MSNKPTINNTEIVAQSRFFKIETVDLTFSNGEQRHFERLASRVTDAVMVMPIHDNHLILIREYACGVEDYMLGLPKGLIDPGEDMMDSANRELQEEAGFGAKNLEFVTSFSMNPGYTNLKTHLVKATDLYPSSIEGDEPEPLEVVKWPLDKLDELLARKDFTEARSIAALMWLK